MQIAIKSPIVAAAVAMIANAPNTIIIAPKIAYNIKAPLFLKIITRTYDRLCRKSPTPLTFTKTLQLRKSFFTLMLYTST